MKYVIIAAMLGAVAIVSGCKSEEDLRKEKLVIDSQLPDGCKFNYYGVYGDLRVGAIVCPNRNVSNTITYWQTGGKNRREYPQLIATIK